MSGLTLAQVSRLRIGESWSSGGGDEDIGQCSSCEISFLLKDVVELGSCPNCNSSPQFKFKWKASTVEEILAKINYFKYRLRDYINERYP